MKFLELAYKVLSQRKKPMSASEIWEDAVRMGLVDQLETRGATPQYTLSSRLYSAANDPSNSNFAFVGVRPKRFYIPGITDQSTLQVDDETALEREEKGTSPSYKEKDLHSVLTYFIRARFDAFSKTINHSKSRRKEFGEWVHPDMVACYFPRPHWKTDVHDLSQYLGDVQLTLYSFEIKQRLSFGNLRESFFQAVSNSSWAHEGYLVAAQISKEPDFHEELLRLTRSFGIGIIELELDKPNLSNIMYQSEKRDFLDWDTVNKLASMNEDFGKFISRVRKDLVSKEIREESYDQFMEPDEIAKALKHKSR